MKLTRTTAALVAALALVAAGCGDDDEDRRHDRSDRGAGCDRSAGGDGGTGCDRGTGGDRGAGGDRSTGRNRAPAAATSRASCCRSAPASPCSTKPTRGPWKPPASSASPRPSSSRPASCTDSTGQVEFVTNAVTQGVDAIMVSNNAGDQIEPAVEAAADAGIVVVSWDSPIPSGAGESLFVAQVDFDETGKVMADMAVSILGDEGGEFAILSASPDAANQNAWIASLEEVLAEPEYASLELVDTVYGNDDADESYNQALALIDAHPDLKLIMAPTTVGIAAAAKAMQDEGLCETVKVSGLGLPDEMRSYTENGCAPQFALWSFVDLGYVDVLRRARPGDG